MSMRKSFVFTLTAGFVALLSAATQPVLAGSASCNGAACQTPGASVDLDINVVIPSMIRMQIGAAGAGKETIVFNPSAAVLGDGSSVSATSGGDTATPGEVTFILVSNTPTPVTVTAGTSNGGLLCQAGGSCAAGSDTIPWDSITVTENSPGACGVTPPLLLNSGTGSAQYGSGGPITENCAWVYTYDNNVNRLDGNYTGTVTYTATTL